MRAAAEERGVRAVLPGDDVYRDADVVFSFVTADQALEAARQTAPHMTSGQSFWDLNSVAPSTKSAAADAVHRHGGALSRRCRSFPCPPETSPGSAGDQWARSRIYRGLGSERWIWMRRFCRKPSVRLQRSNCCEASSSRAWKPFWWSAIRAVEATGMNDAGAVVTGSVLSGHRLAAKGRLRSRSRCKPW